MEHDRREIDDEHFDTCRKAHWYPRDENMTLNLLTRATVVTRIFHEIFYLIKLINCNNSYFPPISNSFAYKLQGIILSCTIVMISNFLDEI